MPTARGCVRRNRAAGPRAPQSPAVSAAGLEAGLLEFADCAQDYASATRALHQSLDEHHSEETLEKLNKAESARNELEAQERLHEAADHHRERAYYSDIYIGAIACRQENKEGGAFRVYIIMAVLVLEAAEAMEVGRLRPTGGQNSEEGRRGTPRAARGQRVAVEGGNLAGDKLQQPGHACRQAAAASTAAGVFRWRQRPGKEAPGAAGGDEGSGRRGQGRGEPKEVERRRPEAWPWRSWWPCQRAARSGEGESKRSGRAS